MAPTLKEHWTALLSSTLETWAHQLLYARHVYPRESFGSAIFLGIRCKVNRHPDVVSYIRKSVEIAIPSILCGVVDKVDLVIIEADEASGTQKHLENYVLKVKYIAEGWDDCATNDIQLPQIIEQQERAMRDLILRVHGLESSRASGSDFISFKITLHVAGKDATCPELDQVFSEGTWISTTSFEDIGQGDNTKKQNDQLIRPLYHLTTFLCEMELFSTCKAR